ncbi:MAG: Crp/Fnr family transcriptional regulator [Flavobacterium sp.]
MKMLKTALAYSGILSLAEINEVAALFKKRKLITEEHFLEFHKVADEIVFVQSGALRFYGLDINGNEITKCLVRENQFFANLGSYYASQPATEALQAVMPTEIYSISFPLFECQYDKIPNLFIFSKTISEMTLLNGINDNDFLNFGDAKTKYLEFLKRYPQLALNVPQQYIASYLKITPQSLSRIRKNL